MTGADGTACAQLPVFPPGFPDGVFLPPSLPPDHPSTVHPDGPALPCRLLSGTRIRCGARAPLRQQRVHAHVCSRCAIREMKFKQYTSDPRRAVGSEIVYNKAFKIYSINRRWIRSSRPLPTGIPNFRVASSRKFAPRVPVFTIFYTRTGWKIRILYEHLEFTIAVVCRIQLT